MAPKPHGQHLGPMSDLWLRQGGTRAQCLVQGDDLVTHGHNAMACCSTERDLDDAYWCSNNDVNLDGMPKAWHKGTMPCAQRWGVMGGMPWLVAAPRDGLAREWCHNGNTMDARACCLSMDVTQMCRLREGWACTWAASSNNMKSWIQSRIASRVWVGVWIPVGNVVWVGLGLLDPSPSRSGWCHNLWIRVQVELGLCTPSLTRSGWRHSIKRED